jgi:hypothetical protein
VHVGVAGAVINRTAMLGAIEFHDDAFRHTGEVGEVGADGMLPTELDAEYLVAEAGPHQSFRVAHRPPVGSGIADET